jgi:diguanylate cyclase (GGDEF)-like protein
VGFVLATGLLLYGLMLRTLHRIEVVTLEDGLTGLPNRLAFTREVSVRCRIGLDRDHHFMLTILDIDHFTDLNDEQGHESGDQLLNLIGQQLKGSLGKDWFIAHIGGDEFGLLSPVRLSLQETRAQLDWLQQNLMHNRKNGLMANQTISAGTCEFPKDARTSQDLMRLSDMALTRAKNQGRNQHRYYREELKRSLLDDSTMIALLNVAATTSARQTRSKP